MNVNDIIEMVMELYGMNGVKVYGHFPVFANDGIIQVLYNETTALNIGYTLDKDTLEVYNWDANDVRQTKEIYPSELKDTIKNWGV